MFSVKKFEVSGYRVVSLSFASSSSGAARPAQVTVGNSTSRVETGSKSASGTSVRILPAGASSSNGGRSAGISAQ